MPTSPLPHLRRGSGAPLVLIPGISAQGGLPARLSSAFRRGQLAPLSGRRDVWAINRRQGLPARTSIQDFAAEYAQTLRGHFSEPVDVVGVSTGGSIALQLAADYPELVRRLVLVSAAYRLSDRGRDIQKQTARRLRAGQPRRAAAHFLSNTATSRTARSVLAVAGFVAPVPIVGRLDEDLVITLEAEDSFDLEHRLESITLPVLVAGGSRDSFYSAELFQATAAGLPNAELVLYHRLGHMGVNGNRNLVGEILRFLDPTL